VLWFAAEDLTIMGELMAIGKPVIDKCDNLREVPEAVRYLEAEHARGKVIIILDRPMCKISC